MRSRIAIPAAALGALVAACAPAPQPPVPVVGAEREIRALAGRWEGSYSSVATGRSGSIAFTLTADGDSATGDVIMIPRGWNRPLQSWDRTERGPVAGVRPTSQVLTINFVRVAAGRVSGTLAPYAARKRERSCSPGSRAGSTATRSKGPIRRRPRAPLRRRPASGR